MRVSEADMLFIPGLGGSGADHWQTRWRQRLSTGRAVEQDDWDNARRDAWADRIAAEIAARPTGKPVVLVAHSLGVIALMHALQMLAKKQAAGTLSAHDIRGALLVSPPSERTLRETAGIDESFLPVPRDPLTFPSLLIASRNDPWATYEEMEGMALDWGAQIMDAGEAGHINAESGHGPWPEGLMRLATFMARF